MVCTEAHVRVRRCCHSAAIGLQLRNQVLGGTRVLDSQRPGQCFGRAPHGGPFTGIEQGVCDAFALKCSLGEVGGETLGDAIEGQGHARPAQLDAGFIDGDGAPIRQAARHGEFGCRGRVALAGRLRPKLPQRLNTHVERAVAALGHIARDVQHRDQIGVRLVQHAVCVEAAQRAAGVEQAHLLLHMPDGRDRGVQPGLDARAVGMPRAQPQGGAKSEQGPLSPLQVRLQRRQRPGARGHAAQRQADPLASAQRHRHETTRTGMSGITRPLRSRISGMQRFASWWMPTQSRH